MIARETYRSRPISTTAAAAARLAPDISLVPGRWRREALLDPRAEHVAHLPIGVEPLRAAALLAGRILRRPVFDIGRDGAGEIERLVVRLGRQGDDQVEIEPLPVFQLLEGHRPVLRDVEADLVHR